MSYLFIEGKLKGESLGKISWTSRTWAWRNGTEMCPQGIHKGKYQSPGSKLSLLTLFNLIFQNEI